MQDFAGFQVHQVHDHGGGSGIHGEAVYPAPVCVNPIAVERHAIIQPPNNRVQGHLTANGVGEDSRLTAQDLELDVVVGVNHPRLTGQSVVVSQETLGVGWRGQGIQTTA